MLDAPFRANQPEGLTHLCNAPNFMVKAVVEEAGIRMPSFFGYMAWSSAILLPLFVVLTFVFFR